MRLILVPALLALTAASGAPAAAQEAAGDKVNQLIIYGNDPCPVSDGAEITVCARKAEAERYRIPEMFRGAESPQNEAWSNRVAAYEMVGNAGIQSCTPVGPGGSTGCLAQMINTAYKERGLAPDVKFAELIEAERAKRLATIDQASAEEQARVESLEKQYEARRLAQESAGDDADAPPPPLPPRN